MKKKKKDGFSLKKRIQYWFDNRIANGSLGLIRALIAASLVMAVLIAGLILLFGFQEDSEPAAVIWDSIATVINAWMPYWDEGSLGYLLLMSVTAIAGVLFTSVLIGIVTSAIEDKISDLRRGNSFVPEQDHIVVLGLPDGEFTLLRQLILAAAGDPVCIVLGEDLDREEMEHDLKENLDVPKNVRIITRTVDITDPASIEKCSVETCRTVIVSPMDDTRTVKAVLAVSALLQEKGAEGVRINAIVSRNDYRFPPSLAEAHNICSLQTNDILAKMIAHSCTQMGISETFKEVFNFEGSEFYLIDLEDIAGWTFERLMTKMDRAVPAGVLRDGKMTVNPPAAFEIREGDRILVFSENSRSAVLDREGSNPPAAEGDERRIYKEDNAAAVLIGCNESVGIILRELPENVTYVTLAGADLPEEGKEELRRIAHARGLEVEYHGGEVNSEKALRALAQTAEHIILLTDHAVDPEAADMDTMFRLLNLRDIRQRFGMSFNITVEMQKEHNQNLVDSKDQTDFLVSSSMASLFLAQLAENPELIDVFREILSNEGNELYLKNAGTNRLTGACTVRELRRNLLRRGYILLGCYIGSEKRSRYDLRLDDEISLSEDDDVIVLGLK